MLFALFVTAPVLALKSWQIVKLDGAVHTPLWQVPSPQVVPLLLLLKEPVPEFHIWQIPGVEGCVHTPLWQVPLPQVVPLDLLVTAPVLALKS